ncbi:hypothetical protein DL240_02450 [Lujinxingia litoralis]|uniref:Ketopantoate reductase N-terminal domain-containing protein n=1 Tax=Lujinxingia litoralis TaxID=2211119 RepID=A0A328CB71_9DELT|nr:2-dehydropantoate 2-reductase N-terminal domain-containing protein [Lujinxingia litoralis]RAL25094.1 hypothetical protein DL240_02450 [Lujinxingia litoralis]
MRVLLVGAGSVGQLYGAHLARSGTEVHVLVRPRYAEEARGGFRVYERRRGLEHGELFTPDGVWTEASDVPAGHFDAAILCIPSTGLNGPWLPTLCEHLGSATLVTLTPGLDDFQKIAAYLPEEQIVRGLITSVSYPAPMPGESASEPGTAYWIPPLTPALFEGSKERTEPILQALRQGQMPARRVSGLAAQAAFGSGVLMPVVAHLETVDWEMARLRAEKLPELARTIEQVRGVLEQTLNTRAPLTLRMIGPRSLGLISRFAPRMTPFDLEMYLKVHFTKVGAQTRMFLEDYVSKGDALNLPTDAIAELRAALGDGES